jgi:hypothetical protein
VIKEKPVRAGRQIMAGQKFTKVLLAVELDGKPYGVELVGDKLLQLLHRAAELSPNGQLSLNPLPNQRIFDAVFEKTTQH